MRYLMVIERAGRNYSAYAPDLPGVVATGRTKTETAKRLREAIDFHLEGLREDGLPIPAAVTTVDYAEVKRRRGPVRLPRTAAASRRIRSTRPTEQGV